MIARVLVVLFAVVLASCSDSGPAGPEDEGVATLTVNAVSDWAFVRFDGDEAVPVTVADPQSSATWDIAFYGTATMLNGGGAGPGDVVGHCLCQNEAATDNQVLAFTPASELGAFEQIARADVPTDSEAWISDALVPAIEGWYAYNPVLHTVAAVPETSWLVKTASGNAYAKFHVTALSGSTQEHAGSVTVEFAVKPTATAPFGPTQTLELDLASGSVDIDLETGAIVSGSSGWDLRFSGYDIRVNGGVSGSGAAGAGATDEPFDEIDEVPPATVTGAYPADQFGGVFNEHSWYRYNLLGNDHLIYPTFDIFLIRIGEDVYKVQLIGYYSTTGVSRHITFRYERLAE